MINMPPIDAIRDILKIQIARRHPKWVHFGLIIDFFFSLFIDLKNVLQKITIF